MEGGAGVVQVWCRCGAGVVQVWCRCGAGILEGGGGVTEEWWSGCGG